MQTTEFPLLPFWFLLAEFSFSSPLVRGLCLGPSSHITSVRRRCRCQLGQSAPTFAMQQGHLERTQDVDLYECSLSFSTVWFSLSFDGQLPLPVWSHPLILRCLGYNVRSLRKLRAASGCHRQGPPQTTAVPFCRRGELGRVCRGPVLLLGQRSAGRHRALHSAALHTLRVCSGTSLVCRVLRGSLCFEGWL